MNISEIIEKRAEEIRNAVLSAENIVPEEGARVFYVSNSGNDLNDGCTPEKAFKTLEKVNSLVQKGNDIKTYICFKRGDVFRGTLNAVDNVTYTAYGEGEKPILTTSSENGADPQKWSLIEGSENIWCFYRDMIDVGALFFEDGGYAVKLCPYIVGGRYEFGIEKLENHQFINLLSEDEAKGLNNANARDIKGKLYFRCDEGNPGEVFKSIEFAERVYCINLQYRCDNIVIDNLHVDCVGAHGIGGGLINGLVVQNCEVSNIGGGIMLYRKSSVEDKYIVARYGNGIELHGACDGYTVQNCWVHDVYDAGITHQAGSNHAGDMSFDNVCYKGNLVERCIYSIEYYARRSAKNGEPLFMNNIRIADNVIRYAGQGFGAQRTMLYNDWNMGTDIMGWFNAENVTNGNFVIENNILDHSIKSSPDRPVKESTSTLLITAEDEKYLPEMRGNIYVGLKGSQFSCFGRNASPVPFVKAEEGLSAKQLFGDETGKIYIVEE